MNIRNFKDKYVFLKDIFNSIKKNIKVKGRARERQLSYKEYRDIVSKYFDVVIEDVAGNVYVKKSKNKRPFHIRLDIVESERTGKIVKYKVPILNNYYNKLVWMRPSRFKKCKILPLTKFKKVIKEVKEY